jgi:hypothetical protein
VYLGPQQRLLRPDAVRERAVLPDQKCGGVGGYSDDNY